ncbi:MAG: hypothetical protein OXE94_06100 [Aestuariivita sp.]|nr:hypothetical protein [Aestuariivita sp.]MCY4201453.1 hypothetical protein [Aestuariivita sp.]
MAGEQGQARLTGLAQTVGQMSCRFLGDLKVPLEFHAGYAPRAVGDQIGHNRLCPVFEFTGPRVRSILDTGLELVGTILAPAHDVA